MNKKIKLEYEKYILNTYGRQDLFISKAKGCYVFDEYNNKYLDFLSGLSVNSLGHCHPAVVSRIKKEAEILMHTSNLYYTKNPLNLAKKIIANSYKGRVFFCNSGTEANEAAIKILHKYGNKKGIKKPEIISFYNSFHGRTLGSLSATAQTKYQSGFEPLISSFVYANYNDITDCEKKVNENTVGVIIELIQAEGGVIEAEKEFINKVYKICQEKEIILVIDEVQTGIGKTGKKFCYMHYDIEPDIMTLAKALGGGLPIGAAVVKEKYKDVLGPGMHAATFGANSLITGVAETVLEIIFNKKFLNEVNKKSEYLKAELKEIGNTTGLISNIRGKGLLIGFDISINNKQFVVDCLKNGLIINAIGEKIIRLSPPLIITEKELKKGIEIMYKILRVNK
ncbi:MAG TPA: aspartate aminotransferase family protein [bacterium]|nr:aspartate aminotransferase family protein [bacterium]HOL47756.1 aspartate aminotransferase family protein [bacterium]HPQ17708.1 aspartate aminotransferase family protein [bacterium]